LNSSAKFDSEDNRKQINSRHIQFSFGFFQFRVTLSIGFFFNISGRAP